MSARACLIELDWEQVMHRVPCSIGFSGALRTKAVTAIENWSSADRRSRRKRRSQSPGFHIVDAAGRNSAARTPVGTQAADIDSSLVSRPASVMPSTPSAASPPSARHRKGLPAGPSEARTSCRAPRPGTVPLVRRMANPLRPQHGGQVAPPDAPDRHHRPSCRHTDLWSLAGTSRRLGS